MKKQLLLFSCCALVLFSCRSGRKLGDKERTKTVQAAHAKENRSTQINSSSNKITTNKGKEGFVVFEINSIPEYIETFSKIAQLEMKAYGIPASITLAQGLLESGYGKGALALKTNNHFGIKCHTGWKGDYDFHDDDKKGECFRKYNHPMYSFRDHSLFLSTRNRYGFLFDYKNTDYKKWAYGLRKAGYATDKKYPQKLIHLIEKHRLDTFDTEIYNAGYINEQTVATENDALHTVTKGETLYSLSSKYNVTVARIMKINNLKDTNLHIGQRIIIRPLEMTK